MSGSFLRGDRVHVSGRPGTVRFVVSGFGCDSVAVLLDGDDRYVEVPATEVEPARDGRIVETLRQIGVI